VASLTTWWRRRAGIPVEVKSSPVTTAPYDAHIFQLQPTACWYSAISASARYGSCIPNRTFAVDYTAQLEKQLLDLLMKYTPGPAQGAGAVAQLSRSLQPVCFEPSATSDFCNIIARFHG